MKSILRQHLVEEPEEIKSHCSGRQVTAGGGLVAQRVQLVQRYWKTFHGKWRETEVSLTYDHGWNLINLLEENPWWIKILVKNWLELPSAQLQLPSPLDMLSTPEYF